ncbi:putative membrane-bound dehydrogenase domain-containing protein [Prosthecobacter debontii]|uniref:Putative membrane-bound dehydrogenase domain-containing protein n=1 Tax=Prosthecobacter debontii TaxID=48467 RepID=A0A1T4WGL8_9BACT|nr:PVC-type heme-binding CxxCH protein [Prosthecobacter debontii]SKA76463.1 putative membrane-bound dehydrogenase domain-containing protein [Prosthecobacter debontii]
MKKRLLLAAAVLSAFSFQLSAFAAEPLRVFVRAGKKSHAPGAHDFPQFLKDWVPMLNERGAKAEGSLEFPTKEQLDHTDVLILHAQEAGNIKIGEERKNLMEFLKRGGGLVVIHAAAVSRDHDWYKNIIGGSWKFDQTKWLEAPLSLYFTDRENPITKDISNFDLDDEIYYDMDLLPEAKILAAAYTPKAIDTGGKGNKEAQQRAAEAVAKNKGVNIYDIQPQMWTYEKDNYRAFTCIPGHWYKNFSHVGLRTSILRGIAWAGKRQNVDELCKPEELGDALRYAEGGVPAPKEMPKNLEVHPEFDLTLVAAEPLINKPMNIDWDAKGRLWVVETPEYPNGLRQANVEAWKDSGSVEPGQYQRDPLDRVSILTDTDGDGVMDKKTVFADKIELATSSVFYKNGIIVCAAPDIWFFEDTNGDDQADKRTKLYTNLGTRDTHAVINNMRWGLDGWVYATHGYSSSENVTSGDGSKSFGPIGSGVVRFKPDGSAIEQYCSRGGNTWGLDITTDGQVFYTQPTSGVLFHHVVLPEYVLAKGKLPGLTSSNGLLAREPTYPAMHWEQQAYVQIDQVGSYTAAAGCAIYEGGAWPEKYRYNYFTTEPTLNIVSRFMVELDGVTYKAQREAGFEQTEFIRSKNLWFRPIEVRTGPDGALYVVDFCNQAVIHNDTRGPTHGPANAAVRPDRDHYYGRIWKVQHKEAKKVEVMKAPSDLKSLQELVKTTSNAHQKQNAWRILNEQFPSSEISTEISLSRVMGSKAMRAYSKREGDIEVLLEQFANSDDPWVRSAMIAAAADHSLEAITAALASSNASKLDLFVEASVQGLLKGPNAGADATKLIIASASAASQADSLRVTLLRSIAQEEAVLPKLSPELTEALKKLLAQPSLAAATLPLVTKWDKDGSLASEVKTQLDKLTATLSDKAASVDARIHAAKALVAVGGDLSQTVMPVLTSQDTPEALQVAIIQALDESSNVIPLVAALNHLKPAQQSQAFEAILKRPQATHALLDGVKVGSIDRAIFAPGDVARLRSHPNKPIAKRANDLFKINSAAKDAIIAKLLPEVEKPGNVTNGKMLFTAACSVCHKLGDIGAAVGPPLDGMGAHGPGELLVHIVDPNREVDPSFWAFNIITKKGEALQGVITSENSATVTLATQVGVREIAKADIDKRENTRRSLMPEGLDGLGAENMRDILAFIVGDATKHFRILNLGEAFTADSRAGVFAGPGPNQGRVRLNKFGDVKIEGVPFFLQSPEKSVNGANLIVLKGGPPESQSQTFAQEVEVPVNVATKRLQLLSGISGWGWPAVKEEVPALIATVVYDNGEKESFTFINGVHFSDYVRDVPVPGSKYVSGLTEGQQMRLLSIELTKPGIVKTLILETPADSRTVPVIAAITADIEGKGPTPGATDTSTRPEPTPAAEKAGPKKGKKGKGTGNAAAETALSGPKEGGKGDGPLVPANAVKWEAGKTRVLVIGGGSSHNFATFFGTTDVETLKAAGFTVHYTEDRDQAAAELKNADVAVISVNRKFFDTAAYRKALFEFADAGKGIIMYHPGTWYGYANWPELNAQIVGGGARGHDKIHPFDVKTVKAHPIMDGVPASFTVEDELYYVNAEPENIPAGTNPIEVLAETSPSDKYNQPHPSVWITKHPKARVVGIALGHDQRVHDLDAFKKLLSNAVKWAGGK